ncbi:MAG: ribonuclease M5 [Sporomusaceae bacterium]|nr:ribonuclease M5 [Sporomusaceae bacterium]
MLKEVIVVEGKQDIVAVKKAVDADCIATGGYSLLKHTIEQIRQAYEKRGIIILTDPDSPGERIRRYLMKRFPLAQHAYIPRREAIAHNDIGVEQASAASIQAALQKVRYTLFEPKAEFSLEDLNRDGLTGCAAASERRRQLGEILGIGFANGKTFLQRLNHYGVTREDYEAALRQMEDEQ